MIIFGSILISLIFAIFLLWKYNKFIVWWEIAILIITPVLISIILNSLIDSWNTLYTEYLGDEVVSVVEEEPYNYWYEQTCSRDVACGTDNNGNTIYCTEYYDCSYQENVGPKWYAKTKLGYTISISEEEYEKFNKQFNSNRIKIDVRKNYNQYDYCANSRGTKFHNKRVGEYSYVWETRWDGNFSTSVPLTIEHLYENRIKASDYSIFNYTKISKDEAKTLNLYEYPEMKNHFTFPSILGYNSDTINTIFNKINGRLGHEKQVRIWVLVHNTNDPEVGYKQECYWVGGNKNELVINIGVKGKDIKWSHVFSWTNITSLKDDIEQFIIDQKVLNDSTFIQIANYVHNETDKRFERLQFSQFDYLSVEPPLWSVILTYVLTIAICIFISVLVVKNSIKNNK